MEQENRIKQVEKLKKAEDFQKAYIEQGKIVQWIQEDEDYARQCADEKWRSNH